MNRPVIACLDLEGVLVPEIWINVADRTGIKELRRTTRDEPDYDKLMKWRLGILDQHRLKLADIQAVIGAMKPLDGAGQFLGWLRERCQVIILSDTFYQFALPLMRQLDYPTLFCNNLEMDGSGRIVNYHMRQPNQKRQSVKALKTLNFTIISAGDSYNDAPMLAEADAGVLFCPPDNIVREFPQFPVARTYEELKLHFAKAAGFNP
jgi:phosphoserine/homoserine phosphotransferase